MNESVLERKWAVVLGTLLQTHFLRTVQGSLLYFLGSSSINVYWTSTMPKAQHWSWPCSGEAERAWPYCPENGDPYFLHIGPWLQPRWGWFGLGHSLYSETGTTATGSLGHPAWVGLWWWQRGCGASASWAFPAQVSRSRAFPQARLIGHPSTPWSCVWMESQELWLLAISLFPTLGCLSWA